MLTTQVWRSAGHRVEADLGFRRTVRWYVDGTVVAERTTAEEKVRLEAEAGLVEVRFSTLGRPRRATLFIDGDDRDGLDLVPEAGSPAATYEDKVREHPTRYAAIATVVGVAKVVLPIVAALLMARLTLPHLSIDLPAPDLPSLPLPDLPSLPLPDLSLPEPVRWVLENAKYVAPVLVAFVLARAEVRRRRRQDEKRGSDQSRS